ncbi:putative ATP synthase epsilon chain [Kosakonia phage Kc263]|uniref:ATP synthase epsilon chain n=1 Tax=Kosakonia phage Kc263 TaxID=2863194 RepID=A0AAE7WFH5_9CAUD|nr:putative ATP synthase epsilon chain [Kosakonia phage Kc263]QYN79905.1 putative ATP synthase epsilon chain [Kosakonia phage Kc263]
MHYVSSLIEITTDDGRIATIDVNTITLMVKPIERNAGGKTKIYHTEGFVVAGYNREQVVEMVEAKRRELWESQHATEKLKLQLLGELIKTINNPGGTIIKPEKQPSSEVSWNPDDIQGAR